MPRVLEVDAYAVRVVDAAAGAGAAPPARRAGVTPAANPPLAGVMLVGAA